MLAAEPSGGQVKLSRMDPLERIVRLRARTVLAVLGIILAVFALLQVVSLARQVLTWMLIAVFFALALDPLVNLLMRRGIPRRGLAIGVTYLLLLCVARPPRSDVHPDARRRGERLHRRRAANTWRT